MASVRKREWVQDGKKKSAWVVDFKDENGKRSQKTLPSKKAADAFLFKIQQELEAGTFVADGNSTTFEGAAVEWLKHCDKRAERKAGVSLSTAKMYEYSVRRAYSILGKKLLKNILAQDVQCLVDELCQENLSGSSVRHTLNAMKLVFDFAIERKWVKTNPVEIKKLIVPSARKVLHIPSKDEIRHLLSTACKRFPHEKGFAARMRLAVVTLAIFGGLRRGEIAGLQWGDVDFDRAFIRIRRSISFHDGVKGPKTAAGIREVPLVQPIAEALRGLSGYAAREGNPNEFILRTGKGRGLGGGAIYADYWQPVIVRAGLTKPDGKPLYRLHDMRHAAASLLIDHGLSPLHIKTMMGHASVTTTLDVYGHLFPADGAIKRAADEVVTKLLATRVQHDPEPQKLPLI